MNVDNSYFTRVLCYKSIVSRVSSAFLVLKVDYFHSVLRVPYVKGRLLQALLKIRSIFFIGSPEFLM